MEAKKKTNREKLEKILQKPIGCYDENMEKLNAANLKKVLDAIKDEYFSDTDVEVFINRKRYVVEIVTEGLDEVDFYVLSKEDYMDKYGYEE